MRIVFTGTHGVGKSTLLNDPRMTEILREVDPHWDCWHYMFWDGIGRKVHTKFRMSDRMKQRYFNYWYAYNHHYHRSYVGSRAIYDTWAYSRLLQGQWFEYRLMSWAVKNVWYDHVFYVPIEFPLEQDGIRYTDPEFQKQHDRETRLILDFYKIPYHTLTGSVDDRLDQIQHVLGLNLTPAESLVE